MKVLESTADFPTWGSSKGTENSQGIWLWRPVGFDYRTSTGLEAQNLGGHKQNLWAPGPRRKEEWPHKILSQTFLWVYQNLWRRCGLTVACHWVRGTEQNSLGISPLEGGCLYCHYHCHSLARPNYREGTQPHRSAENWIKDLLSIAPPIRTRPRFPHNQSLPAGSFHKSLILIHQRADRMESPLWKTNQTDH